MECALYTEVSTPERAINFVSQCPIVHVTTGLCGLTVAKNNWCFVTNEFRHSAVRWTYTLMALTTSNEESSVYRSNTIL